jgi:DNA-binding GntR family transcriptional regulator
VRSYCKLVALVEKRDGAAAEQHWRAHMEAAGRRLLARTCRTVRSSTRSPDPWCVAAGLAGN